MSERQIIRQHFIKIAYFYVLNSKITISCLGSNIKYIRYLKGLKQSDFAKLIGANSVDTLYTYESGRTIPNPVILDRLAAMSGLSVEDLKHKDIRTLPISVLNPETKSVEFQLNDQQQTALEEKVKALESIVNAQAQTIEALQLALKAVEKR